MEENIFEHNKDLPKFIKSEGLFGDLMLGFRTRRYGGIKTSLDSSLVTSPAYRFMIMLSYIPLAETIQGYKFWSDVRLKYNFYEAI